MELLSLPSLTLYDDEDLHIIAEWHDDGTDYRASFARVEGNEEDDVDEWAVFQQLQTGSDTYSVVDGATVEDVPRQIRWLIETWACPPVGNSRNGDGEPNGGAFA